METLLWLDDYRDPMEGQWLVFSPLKSVDFEVHWVKSYDEFVKWIETNGLPTGICFDHDLADEHYKLDLDDYEASRMEYTEKTGFDCAKWLANYCIDNDKKLPLYNIQSANPVGKENIDKLLKNFIKHSNEKN